MERSPREPPNGWMIIPNPEVAMGTQVLLRRGRVVWRGPLGAPIEDAVCDTIEMNPEDHARLMQGARKGR